MKNVRNAFVILAAFFLLGCSAKDNPAAADLINAFQNDGTVGQYIVRTEEYTETDDPNHMIGREHAYTGKFTLYDSRLKDAEDSVNITVEIFDNTQDAEIRHDYIQMIDEEKEKITSERQFLLGDSPILKSDYMYLNGNILLRVDGTLSESDADAYERVLSGYLGDEKYKQLNTVSETEYADLHQKMVEDRREETVKSLNDEADRYLSEVDGFMTVQFSKAESSLTDETMKDLDTLINDLYRSSFYDAKKEGWKKKYAELEAAKKENEAQYQAEIDRVEQLVAETEKEVTPERYTQAKEAVDAVQVNYYNEKFVNDWKSRLAAMEQQVAEQIRQKNISYVSGKLDELEKNLDTALYDELLTMTASLGKDSRYSEYITDWNSRLNHLHERIEAKKKEEEIQKFKDSCVTYKYDDFFRNSESYKGKPVHFTGEVVQVVSQSGQTAELRMNITKTGRYYTFWEDTIYVQYEGTDDPDTTKILEDDIIEIWGTAAGDVTYETIFGGNVTIPAVYAKYKKVK